MKTIIPKLMVGIALMVLLLVFMPVQPAYAEFGTNWTGQFYNCVDFSCGAVATASFPSGINASWGAGAPTDGSGVPIAGVTADNFSARFSSSQSFAGGPYDFVITSQDGVRLYVDGSLVWDQFVTRGLTTDTVTVNLTAGNHNLIVEYFNSTGNATIQVQWFVQGAATPVGATAAPIATARVVSVRGLSVRTGPYLGGSFITTARPDTTYNVQARNQSEGIYTWYLITVGDQTGWSSGRYLEITGDINAIPVVDTIFDQIDGAPDIGVRGVTRAIMNMRVRPSIRTERLLQIPWGDEVVIIGRTIQAGRNRWYHVRYKDKIGWIFAPYITVYGPLDAVPIR